MNLSQRLAQTLIAAKERVAVERLDAVARHTEAQRKVEGAMTALPSRKSLEWE